MPLISKNNNKITKKNGWFSCRTANSTPLKFEPYFNKKGTEINNFKYPYGTISKATSINEPIYTYDIYQCAGLAIIDKKNNKHYLAHVEGHCPIRNLAEDIDKSFEDKDNLEIFIVPGTSKETAKTIDTITSALDMVKPELSKSAEYKHFEDKGKSYLVVYNGEIFASNYVNLGKPNVEIKSVYGAGNRI